MGRARVQMCDQGKKMVQEVAGELGSLNIGKIVTDDLGKFSAEKK